MRKAFRLSIWCCVFIGIIIVVFVLRAVRTPEESSDFEQATSTTELQVQNEQPKQVQKRDMSQLNIVVSVPPGDFALLVVDPHGRPTGIKFATGERLEKIPESVHFIDGLADDMTGEPPTSYAHFIYISHPEKGVYLTELTASEAVPYTIQVTGYTVDNSEQRVPRIEGVTKANSLSRYEITYDPSPGGELHMTPLNASE